MLGIQEIGTRSAQRVITGRVDQARPIFENILLGIPAVRNQVSSWEEYHNHDALERYLEGVEIALARREDLFLQDTQYTVASVRTIVPQATLRTILPAVLGKLTGEEETSERVNGFVQDALRQQIKNPHLPSVLHINTFAHEPWEVRTRITYEGYGKKTRMPVVSIALRPDIDEHLRQRRIVHINEQRMQEMLDRLSPENTDSLVAEALRKNYQLNSLMLAEGKGSLLSLDRFSKQMVDSGNWRRAEGDSVTALNELYDYDDILPAKSTPRHILVRSKESQGENTADYVLVAYPVAQGLRVIASVSIHERLRLLAEFKKGMNTKIAEGIVNGLQKAREEGNSDVSLRRIVSSALVSMKRDNNEGVSITDDKKWYERAMRDLTPVYVQHMTPFVPVFVAEFLRELNSAVAENRALAIPPVNAEISFGEHEHTSWVILPDEKLPTFRLLHTVQSIT